jgi:hypothetical protein
MLCVANHASCTFEAVILIDDPVAECCCHLFEGLLLGFPVDVGLALFLKDGIASVTYGKKK